ncbi:MAG TPA: biotin/lipoyl-containing protein, partial [Actinomycetes bacterium]|nr:biotin/lipoyl-containing protein [Actinomycetes bacterium]
MAFEVVVPAVGEVGNEVTFAGWLKQEGEEVRAGEPLFEVDTDKAVVTIEAADNGRLAGLRVREGDQVAAMTVVAVLLQPGEQLAAGPTPSEGAADETPAPAGPRLAGPPASAPEHGRPPPDSSPRARRLAAELGVDLSGLAGSGPGGLVVKRDVQAAAGSGSPAGARRGERVRGAVAERT